MDEKTELKKASYNTMTEIKDIWNNPVVKDLLRIMPFRFLDIDNMIEREIEMLQKKKLEEFFEILLEDNAITLDDIKDVDCIMETAKTIEVINRLIRNDKVKYLANLLKDSIKNKKRDIDEFEELLNKLDALSMREIDLLYLLYQEEEKKTGFDNNGQKVFNLEDSWEAFVNEAKLKYGLNDSEVISVMSGIMRTGFCIGEWRVYLNARAVMIIYTSPEYRKLLKKIR